MMRQPNLVPRLESFSDGVFAFALTLVVVSLEVPSDLDQLLTLMKGFVGFALMFAMVCWIWYEHAFFFRQFGTDDRWTIFLNAVLLFVVLFYVYPMKFLTAVLMGLALDLPGPRFETAASGTLVIVLYSIGVVLIFAVFVLLYQHALSRRTDLTPDELLVLRYGQRAHLISMGVGLTSIAVALGHPSLAPVAGFIYIVMGPLHAWNGVRASRARLALATGGSKPPVISTPLAPP
jgi:uncharacterized membrane protein